MRPLVCCPISKVHRAEPARYRPPGPSITTFETISTTVDGHLRPLLSLLLTAIHDSKHGSRPSLSSPLLRSSSPSYSLFQSSQGQICPANSASTKHHPPFHPQAGLWSTKAAVCGSRKFPLRNGCQFSQLLVCCYLSYLACLLISESLAFHAFIVPQTDLVLQCHV